MNLFVINFYFVIPLIFFHIFVLFCALQLSGKQNRTENDEMQLRFLRQYQEKTKKQNE